MITDLLQQTYIRTLTSQIYQDIHAVFLCKKQDEIPAYAIAFMHKLDVYRFFTEEKPVWLLLSNDGLTCTSRKCFIQKYEVCQTFSENDPENILYKQQVLNLSQNRDEMLDWLWKLGYYDQLKQILFESNYKYYHFENYSGWPDMLEEACKDFKKNFNIAPANFIANERTLNNIGFYGYPLEEKDIKIFGNKVAVISTEKNFENLAFIAHTPLKDNYFVLSTKDHQVDEGQLEDNLMRETIEKYLQI